jgi:hypothetical protein
MKSEIELVKVVDVYNNTHHVAKRKYDDVRCKRMQCYTADGVAATLTLDDAEEFVFIHRSNIISTTYNGFTKYHLCCPKCQAKELYADGKALVENAKRGCASGLFDGKAEVDILNCWLTCAYKK